LHLLSNIFCISADVVQSYKDFFSTNFGCTLTMFVIVRFQVSPELVARLATKASKACKDLLVSPARLDRLASQERQVTRAIKAEPDLPATPAARGSEVNRVILASLDHRGPLGLPALQDGLELLETLAQLEQSASREIEALQDFKGSRVLVAMMDSPVSRATRVRRALKDNLALLDCLELLAIREILVRAVLLEAEEVQGLKDLLEELDLQVFCL